MTNTLTIGAIATGLSVAIYLRHRQPELALINAFLAGLNFSALMLSHTLN